MASARSALGRLRERGIPNWWVDAKLGMFVHWTPASVPAFAPTHGTYGDLLTSGRTDAFADSPYAEWYENSLRFPSSPVARHHREVWGDRPYAAFAEDFVTGLDAWDPDEWASTFAATGARYVVLVAKHCDGWCLWPTEVTNPNVADWFSKRDLVGELATAVRRAGMRFGLYYCGGLDWTFRDTPMGSMGGVINAIPRGDYPAYADAQVRELIERYAPDILWNDVAWPGTSQSLVDLFAFYYDAVPDGVVNDRWLPWSPLMLTARTSMGRRMIDGAARRQAIADGGLIPPQPPHFDVRTPEYTSFAEPQPVPWECVRGMDHSFAYNAASGPEDFLGHDELLGTLVDIVAKGGNLLLNVGPRGVDGTIPDEQRERLGWLSRARPAFEASLFGTRPWSVPGTTSLEGSRVRYTTRDEIVWATVIEPTDTVTLPDVVLDPGGGASDLTGRALPSNAVPDGLRVELSGAEGLTNGAPLVIGLRGASPVAQA